MKKIKALFGFGLALCATAALASCGDDKGGEVYADKDARTIAVLKYGTHTSLDEIEDGVVSTLESGLSNDYKIKTYDCNFDSTLIAQTLTKIKDDDLAAIVAIATPVAVQAANNFTDVPVVFAAVSDPQSAGVLDSNVTGTSDAMQLNKLIDLAREVDSDANDFGYIYTSTESNSVANAKTLKSLASSMNFNLTTKTINGTAEITETFNAIKDKGIDALIVSDDNNVAAGMDTLSSLCASNDIAMYCAADSEVKDGGMMGYSVSYSALATYTGEQVLQIVRDRKAVSDVEVKYFNDEADLNLYYNSGFFAKCSKYDQLVTANIRARGTDLFKNE